MTARGNIGATVVTKTTNATRSIFHRLTPSVGNTIHAVSAETGGVAFLLQNVEVVDKVGIASNGDIFFYDFDSGVYQITTSQNSGEHWVVVISGSSVTVTQTASAIRATALAFA